MATGTTTTETIDVVTPAAGESVTEGTVLEWHVQVGDFIKVDETIVEISTDKVDVELPSPASGTVVEILAEEGETVTVGQVIARLSPDGGHATGGSGKHEPQAPTPQAPIQAALVPEGDGAKVSPVAARVAAVEGVDLKSVSGTGPAGRIVKADVLEG